nr:MAG TPA: hypothetical protein [Caudoviricetes sp.]
MCVRINCTKRLTISGRMFIRHQPIFDGSHTTINTDS